MAQTKRLILREERNFVEVVEAHTMSTQAEKGRAFRALHERADAFIIPNPWDIGTARLLAGLGFEALATTSAGYAFSAGRRDNAIGRDEMLGDVAAIASATDLPVSGDLENGYGDDPATVADTITRAAQAPAWPAVRLKISPAAMARCTSWGTPWIEYRAAVEAARRLPFPFTLTARAENYLVGPPDLADTIARLQAYQEAGANVLYAPGLRSAEEIASVVRAVDRPVNVVMGLQGVQLSLTALSALGVKRVSVGSALSRAALGAFLRAAAEMRERGTLPRLRTRR